MKSSINKIIREILRLKTPIILLLLWVIAWGLKESVMTASLLLGFIALSMILAHIAGKELFGGYKWNVGEKLNEAWDHNAYPRALLATGMLMARVVIYAAIVISMALLTNVLLRGQAFGSALAPPNSRGLSPVRSLTYLPTLQEEHARIWPESDIALIAGQIEAESNWREKATRLEKSGVTSYGFLQVLDKTFLELKTKNKTLAGLEPVQMLQARYGIRAGLLYDRQMYQAAKCRESEAMRMHYTFRGYNGGMGILNKEIARAETCNEGIVARHCKRKVLQLKSGPLDLCKVNISYPAKIFKYADKYRGSL